MRTITNYPNRYRRQYGRKITRRSEHGQSFVEFALIVPFLFLMLAGVTVLAQGFNLQMVLAGAAYEGARVWAKNPAGGDIGHCIKPACDPDSQDNNFKKYVEPVVRQYIANNGYDGEKAIFFNEDPDKAVKVLESITTDRELVKVLVLYPFELPIGSFAEGFQRVTIGASCTMKRGG